MHRNALGPKFEVDDSDQMWVHVTRCTFVPQWRMEKREAWNPEDLPQPQLRIQHNLNWEEYTDSFSNISQCIILEACELCEELTSMAPC